MNNTNLSLYNEEFTQYLNSRGSMPFTELKIYEYLSNNFKVVFDVGVRDDLDYFKIHPLCDYHLFEPHVPFILSIKDQLSFIEKNFNHKIFLNEYGLSDKNEDNKIYYKDIQSFETHWNTNIPSIHHGEQYSLKKLDNYINQNNISNIDFLKIDVEQLDFQVILGGLQAIKYDNKVSYIQIEYSGGIRQYVDLLDNFTFYLVMEPVLLGAINSMNTTSIDFSSSLIKLDDSIINFIDNTVSPTGNGGNIFGIHKKIINNDHDNLFFKI